MVIRKAPEIRYSEVTPRRVYLNRRRFLSGLLAAGALAPEARGAAKLNGVVKGPFNTDEKVTPFRDVSTYNNYYEFGTGKDEPAQRAHTLRTSP